MTHRGCGCCQEACDDLDYDFVSGNWQDDWTKSAGEEYTKDVAFDQENYQFSVTFNDCFDAVGDTFTISLVDDVGGTPTTVFSQTFAVAPTSLGGGQYRWDLSSTGNAGPLDHYSSTNLSSSSSGFGVLSWTVILRVRNDVIEIGISTYNKSGIYQWQLYPDYMTAQAGLSLFGRFSFGGLKPTTLSANYKDIKHTADSDKLICPPGTCEVIDPYAHIEWRVSNENILGETLNSYDLINHVGCDVFYEHEGLDPVYTDADFSFGSASVSATWKHPTYSTVHRPSGNGFWVEGGTPYLGSKARTVSYGSICAAASYLGPSGPGWVAYDTIGGDPYDFDIDWITDNNVDSGTEDVGTCFDPANHVPYKWYLHFAGSNQSVSTGTVTDNLSFDSTNPSLRWGIATNLYPEFPSKVGCDWSIYTIEEMSRTTFVDIQDIIDDTLVDLAPNHYYAVSSDVGNGLVFTNEGFYEAVKQYSAPIDLGRVLTAQEQTDIQNLLTGTAVVYWYRNGADHYSVDATNGHQGPFGSTGWTEPTDVVIIRVCLDLDYYRYVGATDNNPTVDTYYEYGVPPWAPDDSYVYTSYPGSLPPNTSRPTADVPATKVDPICETVSRLSVDLSDYTLNSVVPCGGFEEEYNVGAVTDVDFGWYVSTNIEYGSSISFLNTQCGQAILFPAIRRYGAEYDCTLTLFSSTWTESGYTESGNIETNVNVYDYPTICWEKIIERPTHLNSLPILAFTGSDLVTADEVIKIIESVQFDWGDWSGEEPTATVETFKITYIHNVDYISSITFTLSG